MSTWLSKAIADFGNTELLSSYRFRSRSAPLQLPDCIGMEIPEYFHNECAVSNEGIAIVEVCIYSNVILHHGDIFGLNALPIVPGRIGYIPQMADVIHGHLEFDRQVVFEKLHFLASTHHSAHNYYHFMVDYLANCKYASFIDEGATPFFVAKRTSEFHFLAMKLLCGVCYPLRFFSTTYLFRQLAIPSLLPKTAVVDFFREASANVGPAGSGRRIYISRRNADIRRVTNEADLLKYFYKYGFEIIESESLSFEKQVSIFKSADIVCAPHGAGLTNIAFCSQGTAVIEFYLAERLPLSAVFWELGCAAGLDYYLVCASRVHNEAHPHAGEGDLVVNPLHLEEAIIHAIERNGRDRRELSILSNDRT